MNRRKIVKKITSVALVFVMALSILNIEVNAASSLINVSVTMQGRQSEARKMFKMINNFRTGNNAWYWNSSNTAKVKCNLGKITYDYELEKVAMQRAMELAATWGHTRPDGSAYSTASTNVIITNGENIYESYGYTDEKASVVFERWCENDDYYEGQGHRRNILGNFKSVGIACVRYNDINFWVQEFSNSTSGVAKTKAINTNVTKSFNVKRSSVDSVSISTNTKSIIVVKGKTAKLPKGTVYVDTGTGVPLKTSIKCKWKSQKSSIAKVSGSTIKGVRLGKTTIKTTVMGKSKKVTVYVVSNRLAKAPAKVTGFKQIQKNISNYPYSVTTITWNKVSGANGYEIYRSYSKNGQYTKIKTTSKTTYTDKSNASMVKCYYKVRAYKKEGTCKKYGNFRTIQALSSPTLPYMYATYEEYGSFPIYTYFFGTKYNLEKYEIYVSNSYDGTYKYVGKVNDLKKEFDQFARKYESSHNIKTGTSYYYKFKAYAYNSKKVKLSSNYSDAFLRYVYYER